MAKKTEELAQPLYGIKEPTPQYPPEQGLYGIKEPTPGNPPVQSLYGVKEPGVTAGSLAIGSATFGRSVTGAKNMKAAFAASIDNMIKVLNGDKYAAMKKTVNANWVGADADDFLADIEKTRAALQKSLNQLKTKFNAAVEADAAQFSKFQESNKK